MRWFACATTFILCCAAVLAAPTAAAADQSVGPWAGLAEQGQWYSHYVQNHRAGFACLEPPGGGDRHYAFVLVAANPADELVLRVGSLTAETTGGVAVLEYIGYKCQRGYVHVYGASVTGPVGPYTLHFVQGHGTGLDERVADALGLVRDLEIS
ncbi:MAG: hypothetical protein ACPGQL_00215 [Thermoplasmatota archaeon]